MKKFVILIVLLVSVYAQAKNKKYKVYNIQGVDIVEPKQYCVWRNDLITGDGHLFDGDYIEGKIPNRALSVSAKCEAGKRLCFGQVSCDLFYDVSKSKTSERKKKSKAFSFYAYATCFSKKDETCPSAFDCMKQTIGQVREYDDKGAAQGYENTHLKKYTPGKGMKGSN